MKKYLEEMTVEELIGLAMDEGVFLELSFNREKTMKKLEERGYERSRPSVSAFEEENNIIRNEKVQSFEETETMKIVEGGQNIVKEEAFVKEELVEEVDFSFERNFFLRRRSSYRNYPNRKLMREVKRIHRGNRYNSFKELVFNYKEIDEEQIKRRETETEINRSKFARGA